MSISDALTSRLTDNSLLRPAAFIGGRWLETAENSMSF